MCCPEQEQQQRKGRAFAQLFLLLVMLAVALVVLVNRAAILRWFMQPVPLWEALLYWTLGSIAVGGFSFVIADRPYKALFAALQRGVLELRERRELRRAEQHANLVVFMLALARHVELARHRDATLALPPHQDRVDEVVTRTWRQQWS